MAQSAPLVAHGGYGPPGGVETLSWVGVGHGVAFGRVFGPVGGVRGVKVGQGGLRGDRVGSVVSRAVGLWNVLLKWVHMGRNLRFLTGWTHQTKLS